jgi:hypothetical protein
METVAIESDSFFVIKDVADWSGRESMGRSHLRWSTNRDEFVFEGLEGAASLLPRFSLPQTYIPPPAVSGCTRSGLFEYSHARIRSGAYYSGEGEGSVEAPCGSFLSMCISLAQGPFLSSPTRFVTKIGGLSP